MSNETVASPPRPQADRCYSVLSPRYWFGDLDLRPLGLFRIAFGVVLILAVADIGPVLFDLLSDSGVMPRSALLGGIARTNRFSIMDFAGTPWAVTMVWVLALLAVFAFTVGWHSRLATVASFLLVSGIHERNLLAFDGADNVIRTLLFWAMFMPVGGRYSVDAVLRAARGRPRQDVAPAFPMRIGQLQIAWVYLNTFLYKWGGSHWHDGTALRYGLGLDHLFTRWLGQRLFNQNWFVYPGTYYAIAFEAAFFFMVFFPFFQPRVKAAALAGGVLLHAGIWLTMNVGNFSYLMPATYFLFWEPEWAEGFVQLLRKPFERRTLALVYDGVCPVCSGIATTLKGFDPFGAVSLVNFRDRAALAALPARAPSLAKLEREVWTVRRDGETARGFDALARAAQATPALWPLGVLAEAPGMGWLGQRIYRRLVAAHADVHNRPGPRPVPVPEAAPLFPALRVAGRRATYALLAFLAFACTWFSLPENPRLAHMPNWMHDTVQELELWQVWDMFSPNPMDTDIWLRGVGQLQDGTTVDVLRGLDGGPLPPASPHFMFSRWTKWINNIAYTSEPNLLEFGRFLCRRWNNDRSGRPALSTFKIYREQRATPPPGQAPPPWGEQVIWDHHCF
ncbi:MAG TPA: DCC1-like thiol-disulfide oxidoreductase family protein [Myxococcales bacterium]|nr:DCC1-like thiol-disulfide oxidoreductase family protein [Myxococcales bacterium]